MVNENCNIRLKIFLEGTFSRILISGFLFLVAVYDETFYSIGSRKFLENCYWILMFIVNRILESSIFVN